MYRFDFYSFLLLLRYLAIITLFERCSSQDSAMTRVQNEDIIAYLIDWTIKS